MARRVYTRWFLGVMVLLFVLNVGGFATPFGDAKRVTAGFPFLLAEWIQIGDFRESSYFPESILINVVVAFVVSSLIAGICSLPYLFPKKRLAPTNTE